MAVETPEYFEFNKSIEQVFDTMPISCICLNEKGEILYQNVASLKITGHYVYDDGPQAFAEFAPFRQPDDEPSVDITKQMIAKAMNEGCCRFQWVYSKPDGTLIPSGVEMHKIGYFGRDAVMAYIRSNYDIAEAAEAKLHSTNRYMQLIMDVAPMAITIWDESYSIIDCNQETLNLFGIHSKQEYIDYYINLLPEYQPDGSFSASTFIEKTRSARENGRTVFEWLYQKPDGELLPVEITATWVTVDREMQFATYVKDLREQKAALKRIRDADYRTQIMLDATPLAVGFWDENLNIVDCNQEAVNLFGLSGKDEFFEKYDMLSPPLQPDGNVSAQQQTENLIETFQTGIAEFEWMHCDLKGEEIPTQVKMVRVRRENVYNIAVYIRDVRELKRTMQALVAAKEEAEAASLAKSSFLSNMSHEIRTPMNAIIGMSDLLMMENLTGQQRKQVQDIQTSSTNLLSIINEILDFSKIEAGKLQLSPVSFNLHDLLANINAMFELVANQKGINFHIEIQEGIPTCVFGDDVRIRQILVNNLGNAIKFTNAGYVKLAARYDGDWLYFDIIDTGIGIKPEDIIKIFDKFQQLDSQKTRRTGGTGLGLTITKNLLEMMNGDISIESVYGKGSTFHIKLPFVPGNEEDMESAAAPESFVRAPEARVLIVDDNEINLNVASGLMRIFDIQADLANSGLKAIEKIQEKDYDLVFMDHMMPEMDGVETAIKLRKMGYTNDRLKIVALTANAISGVRELMLEAGMNDYLTKPIDKSLLNRIMLKWLPPEKILKEAPIDIVSCAPDSGSGGICRDIRKNIDEIDVGLALSRVNGMTDVFESSVHILTRRLPEVCGRLESFLDKNDLAGFAIEVHGAKGSLANIGASALSKLAEELEHKAKGGDTEFCGKHLPEFKSRLLTLHRKLESVTGAGQESSRKEKGDIEELKQKLIPARGFLDSFEGDEAIEIIKEVVDYEYGEIINERLSRLLVLAEEFEYEKAIEVIDSLYVIGG